LLGFRQRNPATNITILSGDIDGNNTLDDENSYHVVTANAVDNTAIIDGFTITMGYAVDAPELVNNEPSTEGAGGGLAVIGGPGLADPVTAVFLRLHFTNNTAVQGAGVYIRAGENNTPQWRNCRWDANHATASGGCVQVEASATGFPATPVFYNCLFHDNLADNNGSVLSSGTYAFPQMIGATISDNRCEAELGAALVHDSPAEGPGTDGAILLNGSIVWANKRNVAVSPIIDLAAQLARAG
jgi:hypothetical protein